MLAYEPSVSFFCIYQAHTVFWKPKHLGLISGTTDIYKWRLWIQMSTPWRAVTLPLRRPPRSCVTAKDCGGRIFSPSPSHLPPKYLQAEMEEFEKKNRQSPAGFRKAPFSKFFSSTQKSKAGSLCLSPPYPAPPPFKKRATLLSKHSRKITRRTEHGYTDATPSFFRGGIWCTLATFSVDNKNFFLMNIDGTPNRPWK